MKAAWQRSFKHGIRFKFTVFIGALIVALMLADALWNMALQYSQSENEALEKAEVLSEEMLAMWDFVDMNQGVINRNEDGTFRTKALVCVVAAKSVSTLFSADSDYTIRFTSETPRQRINAPDPFEAKAFASFYADESLESYYGTETTEDGQRVFRYVKPLYVTETCLECHGDPVGELDQYGFAKEGMQIGDIGGAISITEPMDIYMHGMYQSVLQQITMVLFVLVIASVGIYLALNRWILRPIDELGTAAKQIADGDFSYKLKFGKARTHDEITEFARDFDAMASRLEKLCTDLESEVQSQTDKLSALNDLLMYQKAELKRAIDQLSEEKAYKNEFFAIVSHELRTPLTSILAFACMLHGNRQLDDKTRNAVDDIEANATLLLNMVNNILTISKTEAHKNQLMPEPVDFVDLIGFIKNSLEPIARNKGITLAAKTDSNVPLSMADWEKLRRVVENLVDNAIKYTHAGGCVGVRVSFDEPANAIQIDVVDDGMGIFEDELDNIFELYQQAERQSPNRRYRGTGLGLAVVKQLTELHGGEVSVASTRKLGSTFTVRIPHIPVDTEAYDEDSAC